MRKRLVGLLALFAILVASITANATLIDFDTLASGSKLAAHSVLTTQYGDVLFSGYEDGATVPTYVDTYWGGSPGGGNYWSNGLPGNADNFGGQRRDVLRVSFAGLAHDVGFDFFNSHGASPVTVNFYGASDNLLGSEKVVTRSWQPISFSYDAVSYFELIQPYDNWFFSVDNLRYDLDSSAPVPEPSTLILLGAGLAGAALRRKKRV